MTRVDEDGERALPSGVVHDLRSALFEGQRVADTRVKFLLPRYGERGLSDLVEAGSQPPSLFRQEPRDSGEVPVTSFLDALDVADLGGLA
jgi:hypothetical protein